MNTYKVVAVTRGADGDEYNVEFVTTTPYDVFTRIRHALEMEGAKEQVLVKLLMRLTTGKDEVAG